MSIVRTWWLRVLAVVAIGIVALLFIRLHGALGQNSSAAHDPVARGRALASAWCSECHATEAFLFPLPHRPPAFVAIANQRSTTPLSLKVFLQSSHEPMPNIVLSKRDLDDITAYIVSLRLP